MTALKLKELDSALYKWFVQQRDIGNPVTGAVLQEKALNLNRQLGGPETFKDSPGWLDKFIKRHGLHSMSIQGEKLSADFAASEKFIVDFKRHLVENDYEEEEV